MLVLVVGCSIVPIGIGSVSAQATTEANASVSFTNQTVSNSQITIDRVSVPEGGFVAVHNAFYLSSDAQATDTAIGISGYLTPGVHRNVSVTLLSGVVNQSTGSQLLVAVPSRDTNGNQQYDFVRSNGSQDTAYRTQNNESVTAQAAISPLSSASQSINNSTADVRFKPQNLNQSTSNVTVRSAQLPNGGYVAIHGSAHLDDAATDILGVSGYLSPGRHQNISVPISQRVPGAPDNVSSIGARQLLGAVAYNETNGNQVFDHYTVPNESVDPEYVNASSQPVLETAFVSSADNETPTTPQVSFRNQTSNGSTVNVSSITLSEPGYVAISKGPTTSQLPNPGSIVGVSERLEAGTHRNVSIRLYGVPGQESQQTQLRSSQALTAIVTLDNGETGTYEYVSSEGATDIPVVSSSGLPIGSQAFVNVPSAVQTNTPSTVAQNTPVSTSSPTDTPVGTTSPDSDNGGGTAWWWYAIAVIVVLVVAVLLWRWQQ